MNESSGSQWICFWWTWGRIARQKGHWEENRWTKSKNKRFSLNYGVSFQIPEFCTFSRQVPRMRRDEQFTRQRRQEVRCTHTCASACTMDLYQRISLSLDVLSSMSARQKEHWGWCAWLTIIILALQTVAILGFSRTLSLGLNGFLIPNPALLNIRQVFMLLYTYSLPCWHSLACFCHYSILSLAS